MLIRWVTEGDLKAWHELAAELSPVFRHSAEKGVNSEFIFYTRSKAEKYEALTAVDYMSGENMGFIAFSRTYNRISWLGTFEKNRGKGVGSRLLKTALRQLDNTRPITVESHAAGGGQGVSAKDFYAKFGFAETKSGAPAFNMTADLSGEKRGQSFHYRYPEFIRASQKEFCPVCGAEPAPAGQFDIEENGVAWICAEYPGQGRLFGKIYVMPKYHAFHFEDMPPAEMAAFMNEVSRAGKALRKVTGAVKINYEMHSNTGAHLHIHLFPRYLDDDFPSAPIDYRISEPAPYENFGEFMWFVARMKEELVSG